MRLIVGLGNPGTEYQFTPHNLGFLVVDRLAEAARARVERPQARCLLTHAELEGEPVVLAKPLTYVNLSGLAVRELLEVLELSPEALVVVSDDLALPQGSLRIRCRGGAGGHHGLESIIGRARHSGICASTPGDFPRASGGGRLRVRAAELPPFGAEAGGRAGGPRV